MKNRMRNGMRIELENDASGLHDMICDAIYQWDKSHPVAQSRDGEWKAKILLHAMTRQNDLWTSKWRSEA